MPFTLKLSLTIMLKQRSIFFLIFFIYSNSIGRVWTQIFYSMTKDFINWVYNSPQLPFTFSFLKRIEFWINELLLLTLRIYYHFWVPVSSIDKVSNGWIRDLEFIFSLKQSKNKGFAIITPLKRSLLITIPCYKGLALIHNKVQPNGSITH